MVASAGITFGEKTGWFGALAGAISARARSPRTMRSTRRRPASQRPHRLPIRHGWRIQLDALNLLNSKTDQITYAYGSFLKTDNLFDSAPRSGAPPEAVCQNGVMDRVLHPVEPLAVRLTLTAPLP